MLDVAHDAEWVFTGRLRATTPTWVLINVRRCTHPATVTGKYLIWVDVRREEVKPSTSSVGVRPCLCANDCSNILHEPIIESGREQNRHWERRSVAVLAILREVDTRRS